MFYKPVAFLLAFVTCRTLGLRLTNYANIDKPPSFCDYRTLIPNSQASFTFFLPGMTFNGSNGTLDSILAIIPNITAGRELRLVIGIWRDIGNDSFTLRKALVDEQVAVVGFLNLTFSGIFLTMGDLFGLTFTESPAVCLFDSPSSSSIRFVQKAGSKPIEGETLLSRQASTALLFAVAADITPVTDFVPTVAVTADVTTNPSVTNTTATGSPSFETSQFFLTSTTPTTLSGGLNIPYLCQLSTNPCDSNSICEQTMLGIRCVCKEGYEKISNTSCTDIDECNENDGVSTKCQQICQNTPGGYMCSCRSGFLLANDSHHCAEQNMCTMAPAACKENFTCHSAGGFLQCLPSYVRLSLSSGVSRGAVSMVHVDVPQTVWVSNVWVIVFIVWSGLLSVLAIVLIAWMAHEMRQTKIAIEMEINQDVRLPDSTSLYSGSTLRHGMRFHDGTFTAMKSL